MRTTYTARANQSSPLSPKNRILILSLLYTFLHKDGRGQKGNSEFVVKNIRKDHVNKTEGLDEI